MRHCRSRRKHRGKRGGMSSSVMYQALNKGLVPWGYVAMSNILGSPTHKRKSRKTRRGKGTKKGQVRKTARRAYMSKRR